MKKHKEEYMASRLAREALEDVKWPKQIRYEEIRPYFTKRDTYRTEEDLNEVVLGVAVFTEYLKTRQAYRFHPLLASELNAATELDFRMQDLHLPYDTFYMDIEESHMTVDDKEIVGVYIHNNPKDQVLAMIALVRVNPVQIVFMKASMDYSEGKTLEDSLIDFEGGYTGERSYNHLIFSLIAYLSSSEPDISDKGRETVLIRLRNGKSVPSATRHWDVGYRYVKAYKKELGFVPDPSKCHVQESKSSHRSPRRHLRAAHWHTYLYGPGKKLRKVLWVSAAWVGTGDDDVDVIHVQDNK